MPVNLLVFGELTDLEKNLNNQKMTKDYLGKHDVLIAKVESQLIQGEQNMTYIPDWTEDEVTRKFLDERDKEVEEELAEAC